MLLMLIYTQITNAGKLPVMLVRLHSALLESGTSDDVVYAFSWFFFITGFPLYLMVLFTFFSLIY